jgi:hypothetical protein
VLRLARSPDRNAAARTWSRLPGNVPKVATSTRETGLVGWGVGGRERLMLGALLRRTCSSIVIADTNESSVCTSPKGSVLVTVLPVMGNTVRAKFVINSPY